MLIHRFTYPAILLGTALLIADSIGAQGPRGSGRTFDRTVQGEALPGPGAPGILPAAALEVPAAPRQGLPPPG